MRMSDTRLGRAMRITGPSPSTHTLQTPERARHLTSTPPRCSITCACSASGCRRNVLPPLAPLRALTQTHLWRWKNREYARCARSGPHVQMVPLARTQVCARCRTTLGARDHARLLVWPGVAGVAGVAGP